MIDRRRFPRMEADVLCRSSGLALFHHRRNTQDVSLGGARVFSDERFSVGQRLELEVVLPKSSRLTCWAEVVWLQELDDPAPARFDVGLKFTDMAADDLRRLAAVLGPVV